MHSTRTLGSTLRTAWDVCATSSACRCEGSPRLRHSGQVHQTGPVLTVIVRISLPAGSATGTITYPQLSCSGRLAIVQVAKRKVTLDQTIASGRAVCPDGVITLVSRPAGTVAFTFLRGNGRNPTGTLTRSA